MAAKKYNMGGGFYSDGANSPTGTPAQDNMNMMAKDGGLMGFRTGGGVYENMMKKGGSSTKKGGMRKTARRAYK